MVLRRGLIGLGGAFFFVLAAAQPIAPSSPQLTINIKPQPIVEALNEWAQQTGLQVIVPENEATSKLTSPAVKGRFTPQAALDHLISGTPLKYRYINARTVAIEEAGRAPDMALLPRMGTIDIKDPAADPLFASRNIAEVVVTGSRLRMQPEDIRADGSPNTPTPVTVFTREKLDQLGVSTVYDVLRYLPQQTSTPGQNAFGSGAQFADLRGLGFDTTLILINGRRTAPSANSVLLNAFDLNTLPLAAVDRIEVLSDSGSAVYGTDAVTGVINVILKKNFPDPIFNLQYGTAEGGADERRASLSYGFSNRRVNASLTLDYFDRGILLGSERDLWNNQDFRRFGGSDWRTTSTNPGNVSSLTGDNLSGLSSPFAAVPAGSAGVNLKSEDFLATAGQQNRESTFRYWSIVPEMQARSAFGSADISLTERVNAFAELLYVNRRTRNQIAPPTLTNAIVPANNPHNPFGTDVAIDYSFSASVEPVQQVAEDELYRGVAGLRGTLGSWDWEVSLLRTEDTGSSVTRNTMDLARASDALAATDSGQALNVFTDGPAGSPELLGSLFTNQRSEYASNGTQGAVVLRGDVLVLPAGQVEAVAGGEWIGSHIFLDDALYVDHGRRIGAAFTEFRIPLVSPAMGVPVMNSVTLNVAARADHYSDFGGTFNPQFGLVWIPAADWVLRASYGTSFRAPSLFELYTPKIAVLGVRIPDSARNNESASVTFITGGNPDLESTRAESIAAGLTYTPNILRGLSLSANYWRIRAGQRVTGLTYDVVVANADRFPDRVIRDVPSSQDEAAGLPGVLRQLDISRINFGSVETSGIDSTVEYSIDTTAGRFASSLSATWIDEYVTVDLPGTPRVDRRGITTLQGTIPKWRGVGMFAWQWRGLGLSSAVRYLPETRDAVFATMTPNGRMVGSQTLVDIQASLDFASTFSQASTWWSGIKLTAGISNLFDESPGFAEAGGEIGYDLNQGDLRQRFAYLKMATSF